MKKNLFLKILACVLVVTLTIPVFVSCTKKARAERMQKEYEVVLGDSGQAEPKAAEPDYPLGVDPDEVNALSRVYNVLLIGVDNLEDDEEYSRADAMMIGSLDPDNNKIKLSSILRDCLVEIPGQGERKLNRAYTEGGPQLLMKTISLNFDVKLDNYVLVNFEDFSYIIDAIGGVRLEILEMESRQVFGETRDTGYYLLDGTEALQYVRIRNIDNDFYRTNRQRALIGAVYNKVMQLPNKDLLDLLFVLYPKIETNLSMKDVLVLLYQYQKMEQVTLSEMYFPADGTFQESTDSGEFLLEFDREENQKILKDFLYSDVERELEITY